MKPAAMFPFATLFHPLHLFSLDSAGMNAYRGVWWEQRNGDEADHRQ